MIIAPFLLVTETLSDPETFNIIKEGVEDNIVLPIEEENISIKEETVTSSIEEEAIIPSIEKEESVSIVIENSRTNPVSRGSINRENITTEGKEDILNNFGFPLQVEYIVSSNYGYRGKEFHTGVDMAVPLGTEIYAPYDGTVKKLQSKNTGYGNLIILEHEGEIFTYYAHLSAFEVESEEVVTKGELIGYTGSTGRSTGPHLHYEIRVGEKTINPLKTNK